MPAWRRVWPVLLLILLPILPLWRAVFLGEAIGPWTQLAGMINRESQVTPRGAWDVLQADGVLQFYPWRDLVFHGDGAPTWNPYQLAGTPLLGNSQSAALYPLHTVVGWLGLATALAITLLAWFHLAMAGLGLRYLALRLGAAAEGAWLAGAALILSPFLLTWTVIASVPTTVAWIPWLLGFTVAQLRRPHFGYVAGIAASAAMMILGGHLQFVAYGFMAVVLAVIAGTAWGDRSSRSLRAWLPALGALALGVALAAPQLLPVLKNAETGHRRGDPTAEGYAAYRASALGPVDLVGFVFPNATGLPGVNVTYGEPATTAPSYWPAFIKPGGNYAEAALAISPALLAVILLLRRRREDRAALATVTIIGGVGVLLALGTPLGQLLYFTVPGWSATGSPGRASVLAVLGLLILAALAWPRDGEERIGRRHVGISLAGLFLAFIAMIAAQPLLAREGGTAPTELTRIVANVQIQALPSQAAAIVLTVLALYFLGNDRRWPAALVAAAVPLTLGAFQLVPTGPVVLPPPIATDGGRIAVLNNEWSLLGRANAVLPPNTPTLGRIHDVGGYDSILDRDTVAWLREANGQDPAPPANGNMMFVKPMADLARLAESGVTRIVTGSRPPDSMAVTGDSGFYVSSLPGPGRASVDGRPAKIVAERLDEVTVEAEGPGRLTLRDRNLPGWRASIDGRPVPMWGSRWREVDLPAGTHLVRFQYEPPGAATGRTVGWAALAVLAALGVLALRQSRNPAKDDPDGAPVDHLK